MDRGQRAMPIDSRAEWLCLRQVTRYAAVSEKTVRGWIHRPIDPLPAVQPGGKILIRRSELDTWLGRRRLKSPLRVDVDAIVRSTLRELTHGR